MIDTKKIFLWHFFRCQFFRHSSIFRGANLLLNRAYIPKTISPLLGGVMENFFQDIFVLIFVSLQKKLLKIKNFRFFFDIHILE
jgi:hypothetical protein